MIPSVVRTLSVCQKEILQLVRDRLTFGMVVMIPLIQLVLFGYTINTDVRHVPAAVVDDLNNSFSRQLMLDVQATQVLDFNAVAYTPSELERMIRDGKVAAGGEHAAPLQDGQSGSQVGVVTAGVGDEQGLPIGLHGG